MEGRAISYKTYVMFAKKYGIPTKTEEGKNRSIKALQMDIYMHETKMAMDGITVRGLYIF